MTIVVCANRRYHVMQAELASADSPKPGPKAYSLTDLTRPVIDWPALAGGFGMAACSVRTDEELAAALTRALAEPGPALIEDELRWIQPVQSGVQCGLFEFASP